LSGDGLNLGSVVPDSTGENMNEKFVPASGPVTDKSLMRWYSDQLKYIGFRYGSPIYRATGNFKIEDVFHTVRAGIGEAAETVTLTTRLEDEDIHLHVTSIRAYALTGDEEFLNDLFGLHRGQAQNCFVLEGLLREPSESIDPGPFLTSDSYGPDERGYQPDRVPREDEDLYLKGLAVIMCDEDGWVIDSVIQRLPSPADQVLAIPPY
jgi:hypothetical protein